MADDPEMLDDEDSATPSTEAESSAFTEKLAELKTRCGAAKIEFVEQTNDIGSKYAVIFIPAGRGKRRLTVHNERTAKRLVAVQFEKYRFLSGYDAIFSCEEKIIEASLRAPLLSVRAVLRRLHGQGPLSSDKDFTPIELSPPEALHGRPAIELDRAPRRGVADGQSVRRFRA